jgi:hypothetical protein
MRHQAVDAVGRRRDLGIVEVVGMGAGAVGERRRRGIAPLAGADDGAIAGAERCTICVASSLRPASMTAAPSIRPRRANATM